MVSLLGAAFRRQLRGGAWSFSACREVWVVSACRRGSRAHPAPQWTDVFNDAVFNAPVWKNVENAAEFWKAYN
jgi:hypothetical protein